jgi:2,4-dienoyl-CoA reductase (NADPH2)
MAPDIATALVAEGIDYLVVVRGSIFSIEKTRSDFHEPVGYNVDICRSVRAAVPGTPVFLQGSLDATTAEWAIGDHVCDAAEITRGQLADPDLTVKLAAHDFGRIRPCIRCNQSCQVRDGRNPVISCIAEPSTGHETDDPTWTSISPRPRDVVIVGGGIAGLEAARVAAARGHHVRIVERTDALGGNALLVPHAVPLIEWLARECEDAEVRVQFDTTEFASHIDEVVVQCTGSVQGTPNFEVDDEARIIDVVDFLRNALLPDGPIAVYDPIGGPIGVSVAEQLADRAILITQDQIAGNELSRTGDLAPANVRLAQRGVRVERRSVLRAVTTEGVRLEDRFSGEQRLVECAAVIDCGFRLPSPPLDAAQHRAGDCVAPRTILEAILEGRRVALSI